MMKRPRQKEQRTAAKARLKHVAQTAQQIDDNDCAIQNGAQGSRPQRALQHEAILIRAHVHRSAVPIMALSGRTTRLGSSPGSTPILIARPLQALCDEDGLRA
ncbi:hypothetical protein BJF93_06290 [Xaviernesmea oryzae]|uniref:Uncharacterized protein n=1 Tax=Xaviernesmea oryzae TaxID=464029 RepID=A0A1Q9AS65_9HYPH|nr:hypothetical protein BJF93_06290 [Xaviernesmea oryzae]